MALLGLALHRPCCSRPGCRPTQIDSYIAGLILLAAAPCTAMVFVWSNLSDGEPHFTLSQVALNDIDHGVRLRADRRAAARPRRRSRCRGTTLLLSVVLYIVVPVIVAQVVAARRCWRSGGRRRWQRLLARLQPVSLVALLATLVLLFGFQGEQILAPAAGHRAAGGADPDPGLFQRGPGLSGSTARSASRTASPARRR